MISLGNKVKDSVTGLMGIAVARSEWLWGCVRIAIQPQELKDGKPIDEIWLDEDRLEIIEEKKRKSKIEERTGGPRREGSKYIEG